MDAIYQILRAVDWRFAAMIGIPAVVVVAGWFFVHWLNARRELAIRKREARLKALEAAYMRLAISSNRPLTDKSMDDIETFVSELQLYGTPQQIQLMTEIVEGFKKPNNTVSYDAILADLRDTIRKELNLEPVSGSVWWLRLNRGASEKTADKPLNPDAPNNGAAADEDFKVPRVDPRIEEARRCFNEIYLEGIPLIIRDKSAFLSFVCVLTGIEALSGYRYDRGNVEQRFKDLVDEYFPTEYQSLAQDLWLFRKKMVHAFSPANFALIHNKRSAHLKKHPDGRVILNAEDFFEALRSAAEKFFREVSADRARQRTMAKRLDDLYQGGSIAVSAVEWNKT